MGRGAGAADVLGRLLREGLVIVLAGCAVGLAGARIAGRVIAGFLFQTTPTAPPATWTISNQQPTNVYLTHPPARPATLPPIHSHPLC
mgnify:CR=1 FL=1